MSATNYMDRVMGLLHLPQDRIKRAPKNWRTHEGKQKHVMRGLLNEVGVVDAVKVWVPNDEARAALRKAGREGFQTWAASFTGDVALFDGHMRNEEIRQIKSALVTDLDAEEAEKALATFDPVGAMAGKGLDLLKSLLSGVKAKERGTADLLDELLGAPAPLAEPKPDKGPAPGDTGQKAKRVDLMFDDRSYELFLADCDAAMAKLGTRKAAGIYGIDDAVAWAKKPTRGRKLELFTDGSDGCARWGFCERPAQEAETQADPSGSNDTKAAE